MDNFMKKAVPVMAKAGEYIVTYLAFLALAAAPLTYMGRMLQKDATVTVRVAGVIAAVILCAAFFSLVRGYIMFDDKLRTLYASLPEAPSRFFEKCVFFLRRPAFWVETAAVVILFWILPPPDGEMLTLPPKWMLFSVLFPLFFSLNLAARLSVARWLIILTKHGKSNWRLPGLSMVSPASFCQRGFRRLSALFSAADMLPCLF